MYLSFHSESNPVTSGESTSFRMQPELGFLFDIGLTAVSVALPLWIFGTFNANMKMNKCKIPDHVTQLLYLVTSFNTILLFAPLIFIF